MKYPKYSLYKRLPRNGEHFQTHSETVFNRSSPFILFLLIFSAQKSIKHGQKDNHIERIFVIDVNVPFILGS